MVRRMGTLEVGGRFEMKKGVVGKVVSQMVVAEGLQEALRLRRKYLLLKRLEVGMKEKRIVEMEFDLLEILKAVLLPF